MTTTLAWRMRCLGAALALVIGSAATPPQLWAQGRARTPQVAASIIPEARSIRPGTPLRVAIRLVVAPGWHIYWTNPGESGLPTTVRWQGPAGFVAGPLRWPYPQRKQVGGLVVHAYQGEVVLLGEVYPPSGVAAGQHAEIAAQVRWGVCREVCIPQAVRLSFRLPVRDRVPRLDPRWQPIATAAAHRFPQALPGWRLAAQWDADALHLRVDPPASGELPGGLLTFFPDDASLLPAAVAVRPERGRGGVVLRLNGADVGPEVSRLQGVLVADAGWGPSGRIRALRVDVPLGRP